MNIQTTFSITISTDYSLQCSIIKNNNEGISVSLQDNNIINYQPCISFEENKIQICQPTEKSIYFMKDFIEEPNNFKYYSIVFQQK